MNCSYSINADNKYFNISYPLYHIIPIMYDTTCLVCVSIQINHYAMFSLSDSTPPTTTYLHHNLSIQYILITTILLSYCVE